MARAAGSKVPATAGRRNLSPIVGHGRVSEDLLVGSSQLEEEEEEDGRSSGVCCTMCNNRVKKWSMHCEVKR